MQAKSCLLLIYLEILPFTHQIQIIRIPCIQPDGAFDMRALTSHSRAVCRRTVCFVDLSTKGFQFSTLSDFICLHFFFACVLCLLRRNHGYSSSLNRVLGSTLTLKGGIS